MVAGKAAPAYFQPKGSINLYKNLGRPIAVPKYAFYIYIPLPPFYPISPAKTLSIPL